MQTVLEEFQKVNLKIVRYVTQTYDRLVSTSVTEQRYKRPCATFVIHTSQELKPGIWITTKFILKEIRSYSF